MPIDDLEEKALQNLGPMSALPQAEADEVIESLHIDFEDAIVANRRRMVGLCAAMVADAGYSGSSDHTPSVLQTIFEAAGKTLPDNLPQTPQGMLEIQNADLAKVVVEIAKADGAGWWERQKLMRRMKKPLGSPE